MKGNVVNPTMVTMTKQQQDTIRNTLNAHYSKMTVQNLMRTTEDLFIKPFREFETIGFSSTQGFEKESYTFLKRTFSIFIQIQRLTFSDQILTWIVWHQVVNVKCTTPQEYSKYKIWLWSKMLHLVPRVQDQILQFLATAICKY